MFTGPSVPMMFGVGEERPRAAGGQNFYPVERTTADSIVVSAR